MMEYQEFKIIRGLSENSSSIPGYGLEDVTTKTTKEAETIFETYKVKIKESVTVGGGKNGEVFTSKPTGYGKIKTDLIQEGDIFQDINTSKNVYIVVGKPVKGKKYLVINLQRTR